MKRPRSILFILFFLLLAARPRQVAAMGGTVPAGYPNTFLMGMVSNYFPDVNNEYGYGINAQVYTLNTWEGPVGGSAFDMSYRYLNAGYYSEGTTGGNGWANSPLGAGYPLTHHANLCAQYGYSPVFIYYQIGNEVLGQGGTSPNDPAGMGLYYQDWTYTMHLIDQWLTANTTGAYNPTVTVDVEPDFSGSVEQSNLYAGFGPTDFAMNVANCTIPSPALAAPGCPAWVSLTGFGNNFQGYCAALLHIKDQIVSPANNSRIHIAFHISAWATNGSPASNVGYPYPLATVAAHALTIANFVNACQPASGSKFDLFFNDPSGYDGYDPDGGGSPNVYDWSAGGGRGMFDQYVYFLDQLSTLTNLRSVLWQMPLGNSKMANVDGHYKDERPEYFLADSPLNDQGYAHNVCQYMAAGVLGILWGAGDVNTGTNAEDMILGSYTEDGTANGGSGSWTAPAPAVIDNDGGFMRTHASNAHLWASECGNTNTPTASMTQTATNTVTNTATNSATSTATHTATQTSTNTATATRTNTETVTNSPTMTSTQSATSTITNSSTSTSTSTLADTATSTITSTATVLMTATSTLTDSPTLADTATSSTTSTATSSSTFTANVTSSQTATDTSTKGVDTATSTTTSTSTLASTATMTASSTSTVSTTGTSTSASTNTATSTATGTSTSIPAANTATSTATASLTGTSTPVFTFTFTPTVGPDRFFVSQNIFTSGSTVSISVSISKYPGSYDLTIYNSAGEMIKNLDHQQLTEAFSHTYAWDGKNKYNAECASGIYVIYMTGPFNRVLARIAFLRR